MRVAVVTPYLPWPADTGGKLRSYYLLKGLAEVAEVDLYTVCYGAPPVPGSVADFCRSVSIVSLPSVPPRRQFRDAWFNPIPSSVRHFHSPTSVKVIGDRLNRPYDLLVCDEICMTPYFEDLATQKDTPRLIIRHKVDHLHHREVAESRRPSVEKVLAKLEADRLASYEIEKMPLYQAAVVCSEEDGQTVARQSPGIKLRVIVNGADTEYFTPVREPDPEPTILLLGTMSYYPNIDAVQHFFSTIYPTLHEEVPNLQILVVGHQPPPEVEAYATLPGVSITGSVPDVRPFMARSWIMAVPLRLGGGTRLKIVEAMAAGLPVISTSVGAQGIDVVNGQHLLLADSPEDFAACARQLLQNADQRAEIADAALSVARDKYGWQGLGREFADFCTEVAASRSSAKSIAGSTRASASKIAESQITARVPGI